MKTYVHDETSILAAAETAARHGFMLLTRVNPSTGKQQTVIGVAPVGEWKRLNINAARVSA